MSKPTLKMTHGAIGEAMCCYTDGSYKDADIALTEYEKSIREDERKKFAEWLENKDYLWRVEHRYGEQCTSFITAETILAEYEKEKMI